MFAMGIPGGGTSQQLESDESSEAVTLNAEFDTITSVCELRALFNSGFRSVKRSVRRDRHVLRLILPLRIEASFNYFSLIAHAAKVGVNTGCGSDRAGCKWC